MPGHVLLWGLVRTRQGNAVSSQDLAPCDYPFLCPYKDIRALNEWLGRCGKPSYRAVPVRALGADLRTPFTLVDRNLLPENLVESSLSGSLRVCPNRYTGTATGQNDKNIAQIMEINNLGKGGIYTKAMHLEWRAKSID
ncbi:hypothetical protein TNCV_226071 [Trichonephila clavipes]|nr:hypothetical protein TNCV_226071 [Trichonephila clavipes]